jgi:hypothetical protein
MKEILTAEAECDRSLAELGRLKAELQRFSAEEHALQAEITALQQSPQMKDAQLVEQAHREAAERRRDAESASLELAEASRLRKRCSEEHVRMRTALEQRQNRLSSALRDADPAAAAAGLEAIHRKSLAAFDIHAADPDALKRAQETIEREIHAQIEKLNHARVLTERQNLAKIDLQRAGAARDQLGGLLVDARERLNAAHEQHRLAITAFLEAASDWTADLTELPLPFDEAFLRSVTEWCDRPGCFQRSARLPQTVGKS